MAAMQAGTFAAATFASAPVARQQVAVNSSLGASEVGGLVTFLLTRSARYWTRIATQSHDLRYLQIPGMSMYRRRAGNVPP